MAETIVRMSDSLSYVYMLPNNNMEKRLKQFLSDGAYFWLVG